MNPDLMPHDRDRWADTQSVVRTQQRSAPRPTYGSSPLLDGLNAFVGQVLRLGICAVVLVFVLALLVSTLTGASR